MGIIASLQAAARPPAVPPATHHRGTCVQAEKAPSVVFVPPGTADEADGTTAAPPPGAGVPSPEAGSPGC